MTTETKRILRDENHALLDEVVTTLSGMLMRCPKALFDEIEDVLLSKNVISPGAKTMKVYLRPLD